MPAAHQLAPDRADAEPLPELAAVYWRARADEGRLMRTGRLWTITTVAHTLPLMIAAALLVALDPVTAPVGLILLAHAWIIPELYAARGANVVRARSAAAAPGAQIVALGLLGDLVDQRPRELLARTGLLIEPGRLGVWLVAEAGALLVRPGAGRVHCYCVKVAGHELPPADQIAHLLLALRADEAGFATVANLAFCGARWRLRRRLPARAREALEAAAGLAQKR